MPLNAFVDGRAVDVWALGQGVIAPREGQIFEDDVVVAWHPERRCTLWPIDAALAGEPVMEGAPFQREWARQGKVGRWEDRAGGCSPATSPPCRSRPGPVTVVARARGEDAFVWLTPWP